MVRRLNGFFLPIPLAFMILSTPVEAQYYERGHIVMDLAHSIEWMRCRRCAHHATIFLPRILQMRQHQNLRHATSTLKLNSSGLKVLKAIWRLLIPATCRRYSRRVCRAFNTGCLLTHPWMAIPWSCRLSRCSFRRTFFATKRH